MKAIEQMTLIEVWERADALRVEYYEAKTAIEKDPDLTMDARTRKLLELKEKAGDEMSRLKAAWVAGKNARKEEIIKRAFGVGHKADASEADRQAKEMNYRAALEVAAKGEKPDDFLAMLEQATVTGDALLKKAFGLEARRKGFNEVLRLAMDDSPDFKELVALDDSGRFLSDNTHFTGVN